MGLVVPLCFPGMSLHRERRPSTMAAIISMSSSGTPGPWALVQPGLDRSSPP